jgi:hypothetical protein
MECTPGGWGYFLQYVDDLFICGPPKPIISRATESLVNFLAGQGYKVSREKTQLCSPKVKYLSLVLEKQTRSPGPKQLHLIVNYPLPKTFNNQGLFWESLDSVKSGFPAMLRLLTPKSPSV